MVGQRFTGMEFITMCRERYQVEKGIFLSVLTLNASEILIQCASVPHCSFHFQLEYEDDISCWVVQEPYPLMDMCPHTCKAHAHPQIVAVPSTPPAPLVDVVNLVSPEENEPVGTSRKRRVSSNRRVVAAGYTCPSMSRACKTPKKKMTFLPDMCMFSISVY